MTSSTNKKDARLVALASEISDARNSDIPRLLYKVQDIVDSYTSQPDDFRKIKQDIWDCDLFELIASVIKQDFTTLPEKWRTSARLVQLLSVCCAGFLPQEHVEGYRTKFLPRVLESFILLAKKLYMRYMKTPNVLEDTKKDLIDNLKLVFDSIMKISPSSELLIEQFLESPYSLQILMTDDIPVAILTLNYVQSVNKLYRNVMGKINQRVFYQILDELIYKLSTTTNSELAGFSIRTVISICNSHEATVPLLCIRYKGLRPLLKKWTDKGFDRDLKMLQDLLDAGDYKQAKMASLAQSASVIQSFWRSYSTRKKLRSANTAMAKFQRTYRTRKAEADRKKEEEKLEKEMAHWLWLERRRTMRQLRHKQMEALRILHAADVPKFLEQESTNAALKIQKVWRGYRERAGLEKKRQTLIRVKAAIKIQRQVRRWLERQRDKKKEPLAWQRPPGLTEGRRVELQDKMAQWRELHPVETKDQVKRKELHEKVQLLINQRILRSKSTRITEQHREALLACLQTDSQLLMDAPKLADVTAADLPKFVSRSVPVAALARQTHQRELQLLRQPWWKKLEDRLHDDEDEVIEQELPEWRIF